MNVRSCTYKLFAVGCKLSIIHFQLVGSLPRIVLAKEFILVVKCNFEATWRYCLMILYPPTRRSFVRKHLGNVSSWWWRIFRCWLVASQWLLPPCSISQFVPLCFMHSCYLIGTFSFMLLLRAMRVERKCVKKYLYPEADSTATNSLIGYRSTRLLAFIAKPLHPINITFRCGSCKLISCSIRKQWRCLCSRSADILWQFLLRGQGFYGSHDGAIHRWYQGMPERSNNSSFKFRARWRT